MLQLERNLLALAAVADMANMSAQTLSSPVGVAVAHVAAQAEAMAQSWPDWEQDAPGTDNEDEPWEWPEGAHPPSNTRAIS